MFGFKEYARQFDLGLLGESSLSDAKIVHLYHHLPTIQDVARESGRSVSEVYRALKRSDVRPYRRKKPTYEAVFYYFKAGLPLAEIAKLTDYSVRNVQNIIADHLRSNCPCSG